MRHILLIGADGQLGNEIMQQTPALPNFNFTTTTIDTLDITNQKAISDLVDSKKFEYIINCAAYTAVDKAESDKDLAYEVNANALNHIGEIARLKGIKVIHVSTDYVFDGKSYVPYTEDMPTKPTSVYGQTKREGEIALLNKNPQSIILRTSWLYSSYGANFVKTMIKLGTEREQLGVIFDQIGTPTYAADLAGAIIHMIKTDIDNTIPFAPGIYHYSNEGVASWYDFTLAIHKIAGITCNVNPIETKDYPTPAPRPLYSLLNKSKIKKNYNRITSYNVCYTKLLRLTLKPHQEHFL